MSGNDVFFENELQQIGEGLQQSAGTDAVWSKPALDETENAPFGKHGVRDDEQHDHERHRDGCELQCDVNGSLRIHNLLSIADCQLPI